MSELEDWGNNARGAPNPEYLQLQTLTDRCGNAVMQLTVYRHERAASSEQSMLFFSSLHSYLASPHLTPYLISPRPYCSCEPQKCSPTHDQKPSRLSRPSKPSNSNDSNTSLSKHQPRCHQMRSLSATPKKRSAVWITSNMTES